jgi:predicted peroxiredoxin
MKAVLIIETRDAADHKGPARMAELAAGMCEIGVPATIFLTENAAFAARRGPESPLDAALSGGVQVAVDEFALKERGIGEDQLRDGIAVRDVDLIVDGLEVGATLIWR